MAARGIIGRVVSGEKGGKGGKSVKGRWVEECKGVRVESRE